MLMLHFLSLKFSYFFGVLNVNGCEDFTHPLGREEKPWVKGLVGLNNVVEKLSPCEGEISWSMGSIEAIFLLLCYGT